MVNKGKYGVPPEVRSYNTVISGHERAGEWREALALAKKMERAGGVPPNVVTFNSVIGACKRAGRAEEALAVLSMLRRKGLQPDVISFNSAIGACARCVCVCMYGCYRGRVWLSVLLWVSTARCWSFFLLFSIKENQETKD